MPGVLWLVRSTCWVFLELYLLIGINSLRRGILVPGGFGTRGTEGMVLAIKWAREQQVPFLGICLGFQAAVIEWARNVCGWKSLWIHKYVLRAALTLYRCQLHRNGE